MGLSSAAKTPKLLLQASGYLLAWLECATAATSHDSKMSSDERVEVLVGRIISPSKNVCKGKCNFLLFHMAF